MDLRGSLHATDLSRLVGFLAAVGTSGRLCITRGDRWGRRCRSNRSHSGRQACFSPAGRMTHATGTAQPR